MLTTPVWNTHRQEKTCISRYRSDSARWLKKIIQLAGGITTSYSRLWRASEVSPPAAQQRAQLAFDLRVPSDLKSNVARLVVYLLLRYTGISQNHRIVGVGRDLCGSSSPTLLPKQGHLQQAAQDLVQATINCRILELSDEYDNNTVWYQMLVLTALDGSCLVLCRRLRSRFFRILTLFLRTFALTTSQWKFF